MVHTVYSAVQCKRCERGIPNRALCQFLPTCTVCPVACVCPVRDAEVHAFHPGQILSVEVHKRQGSGGQVPVQNQAKFMRLGTTQGSGRPGAAPRDSSPNLLQNNELPETSHGGIPAAAFWFRVRFALPHMPRCIDIKEQVYFFETEDGLLHICGHMRDPFCPGWPTCKFPHFVRYSFRPHQLSGGQ